MSATSPRGAGLALTERLSMPKWVKQEVHNRLYPCCACGSSDAFSVHVDTGVFKCHSCGDHGGAIELAERYGLDRKSAVALIVDLGILEPRANGHAGNGHVGPAAPPKSAIDAIAALKYCPADSLRVYGAKEVIPGKVAVPAYGGDGKRCGDFYLDACGKGKNQAGKSAGMFFPHNPDGSVRLPVAGEKWHVVEGPKDAAALHGLGFLAAGLPTANFAEKFVPLFAKVQVVLVPDRDTAGEDCATVAGGRLKDHAASIAVVTLPVPFSASKGQDVRDVLRLDGGRGKLIEALDAAVPWSADRLAALERKKQIAKELRSQRTITNALVERDENGDETVLPLPMGDILNHARRITHNWPRRIGNVMFVHPGGRTIDWIDSPQTYFGWAAGTAGGNVHWRKNTPLLVDKAEFFAEFRRTATRYEAVETIPHFPPIAGHYYACPPTQPGDGTALKTLLDRFSPASDIDRDLLLAMFATPAWGGPPGSRPAFVLTGTGRGIGKSTAAKLVGRLFLGAYGFDRDETIKSIKERLLTPSSLAQRVAVLDNIKSLRFSWAEMESLVTAPTISGRQMYFGDGNRPNVLTWILTLNGASLSTDMAQRCVIVNLATPKHSGDWESETIAFIENSREAIIADLAAFFVEAPLPLAKHGRWGEWEKAVLGRLPEPGDAQRTIFDRQGEADVELEESAIVEEYFADRLEEVGCDPASSRVRIPNSIACDWYCRALGEKQTPSAVTRVLKQFIKEERLKRLSPDKSRAKGRCFMWTGENHSGDYTYPNLAERISEFRKTEKILAGV